MKLRILLPTIMVAYAFSILYVSAVQAGETDMKNLEVKLGFTQIPDEYTCDG